MAKEENIRVYNPRTARFEAPKAADAFRIEEHKAMVEGKPAPGDRTEEQLRGLSPAEAGPVVTTGTIVTPTNVEARTP